VDRRRRVLVVLSDFAGHGGESRQRLVTRSVWVTKGPKLCWAECGELAGVLAWFGQTRKMLQKELQTA
jgi:hypothetical protein